jgi:hypothetical protein
MVEREEENSFYLNQIDRIQIATPLTVFFSENREREIDLSVRFFDRNNRPLFNNMPIPYELLLTDSIIDNPTWIFPKKALTKCAPLSPPKGRP